MSDFIVSARKYRPSRFDEVVGQQHVSNTLKNALQHDHLAHSFLFCGPRGVGKTTCARILAKTINCENPTEDYEACNVCSSCQAFNENASFNITELDAASNNSVEHIRTLIEQVRFQPQQGRYKVFIIDEVHMLSQAAFNAFLKTLEEPPSYAIFILATTEKHKIIPTILSRCQIFDFRRILIPDIVAHLQEICKNENIQADKEALHIIAQKADGALRDALSIFDRIVSFSNDKITYQDVIENLNVLDYDYYFKVVEAMLLEDLPTVLNTFDEIIKKGFDPDIFVNGLAEHIRNLLVSADAQTSGLAEVSKNLQTQYQHQAQLAKNSFLLSALNILNDCDVNYKMARNKRLHVEMAIIKLTFISRAINFSSQGIAPTPTPQPIPKSAGFQVAPASPTVVKEAKVTLPVQKVEEPNVDIKNTIGSTATSKTSKEKPVALKSAKLEKLKATVPSLLKIDLKDIHQQIQQEDQEEKEGEESLSQETIEEAWKAYTAIVTSPSVRNNLNNAKISLKDQMVHVLVGSKMSRQMILDEKDLMEFIRNEVKSKNLSLQIEVDTALAPKKAPKVKKALTLKDKYAKMKERNPLVEEFRKRFDLKLDK